jgi:hypothetical protein
MIFVMPTGQKHHWPNNNKNSNSNRGQQQQHQQQLPLLQPLLLLPDLIIPSPRRHIQRNVFTTFYDLVQQHHVGGFLVSWPIQVDTGKMGANCGRVWYTLEALQSLSSFSSAQQQEEEEKEIATLFSCHRRPICLWDPFHTLEESKRLDTWGRCWEFTRTSTATEYSSKKRYHQHHDDDDDDDAIGYVKHEKDEDTGSRSLRVLSPMLHLWNDFCHAHWPEASLAEQQQQYEEEEDECQDELRLGHGTAMVPLTAATLLSSTTTTTTNATSRSKHLIEDRQLQLAVVNVGNNYY